MKRMVIADRQAVVLLYRPALQISVRTLTFKEHLYLSTARVNIQANINHKKQKVRLRYPFFNMDDINFRYWGLQRHPACFYFWVLTVSQVLSITFSKLSSLPYSSPHSMIIDRLCGKSKSVAIRISLTPCIIQSKSKFHASLFLLVYVAHLFSFT